jgi:hypothetical protein
LIRSYGKYYITPFINYTLAPRRGAKKRSDVKNGREKKGFKDSGGVL